jgi:hypothetical protein
MRWLEGLGQAAISVAAASLVLWWLAGIMPEGTKPPDAFGVLRNAALTGFVLGFFVPTWYRRAVAGQAAAAQNGGANNVTPLRVPGATARAGTGEIAAQS